MGLLFLRIKSEEAVAAIQGMILRGYQLKDSINKEHEQARIAEVTDMVDIASSWSQRYNAWTNNCIGVLITIYESEVYAYNFRDANSLNVVSLSGNPTRSNIVLGIQYRVEKLNEYEKFIRSHLPMEINVNRDLYLINGDRTSVRTKN